ncbi:protein translocase subunit SecF [Microvirga lenta]|uniref:protein translocase subunit SecF n=1 Tax=Microvirga lenta TaxID=2881337 RepID=UPI001CFF6D7F|nr:protein translocase subunit SecF [Microvirga lenta]MCB5176995.1 protein translocase subunit SecF [Microvirga lenta]
MLIRYFPTNTKYEFMRYRRVSFPLSAILSLLTVVLFFAVGMSFGIDFKGGTLIEMRAVNGMADVGSIRERAGALGFGSAEVQGFGDGREVSVRIELQPGGEQGQQMVVSRMRETFGNEYEFRRIEVVGPRVSGELVQSGTLGVILALLAILAYLWFRFEWQYAIGAVVATLHDIVLTIGFFAVTQIQFDMTSIAAILTIMGYSLNDTVVVYDRIRETMRKYKKVPVGVLLDQAINETLTRTIITGFSTALAVIALAVFGGEVLRGFSYTILFGLIVGTYSSVFIAAPILVYFGLREGAEIEAPAASAKAAAE